jgi:aspartyl-tRNA(Asn)/glutamyl-tRNA(Gln) amidotransferase subunit B
LKQISDSGALEKVVDEVLRSNPKQVEQYKGGKSTVIGYLVGQAMKPRAGKPILRRSINCSNRSWTHDHGK